MAVEARAGTPAQTNDGDSVQHAEPRRQSSWRTQLTALIGRRSRAHLDGPLIAILLIAAAARAAVIIATPHYHPVNDAADYDRYGVSLADHATYPASTLGGPTAFYPPGFPVLLALVYRAVGAGSMSTRWAAGRIAQALLGVLAVALIYMIGRRLKGRMVGLTAAGLAAVYPPLVLAGSSLMSEPLYIALTLAAVLAALVHRQSPRGLRYAVLAGVLAAVVAMTRGNGIFFVLPLVFLVWSERPRRSWSSLRAPLALLAATLIALAPWAIRNTIVFHKFVPLGTETGYAFSGTYNNTARNDHKYPALWQPTLGPTLRLHADRRLNEADISNRLITQSIDFVRAHPGYPFEVAFWSFLRLLNLQGPGLERAVAGVWGYPRWLAVVSVYAFWLVALLAILAVIMRRAGGAPWAFWACPLALIAPSLLFLGLTRYRVPADPYVLLLAALGALALREPATTAIRSLKSGVQRRSARPASSASPTRARDTALE
jgi:4-amino-4-deoxy-L-arabinose transferase-like glycosyltransferase